MKLLNVRLGAEDAMMVEQLRKQGFQISRVVRDAIRDAYGSQVARRRSRRRPSEVMGVIYASHPDPPRLPHRRLDLRDRRSVRRAIRESMRRHP